MNAKIRRQLKDRKRKIQQRLDKTRFPQESPVLSASNIHYEIAERTRATAAGGIGVIQQMVRRLELDELLNEHLNLLKIYLPYSESDHVLNIAYNLLAGGTCLEHLELRRHDEAYLDAPAAQRIPDPTTAGDFCRRFDVGSIYLLQEIFNAVRTKVWRQQPDSFFGEAVIDAMPNLYEQAENLPLSAWKRLRRKPRYAVKTKPRRRPENVKQKIVEQREFQDIRLVEEHVAEFAYRPVKCNQDYRVVVVWKDLEVHQGQRKLFDKDRCFFYITNDWESSAAEIVFDANGRCNQENLIEQQKRTLLRMGFATFRQALINIPAQIVRSGRRLIFRLLGWNAWQDVFFRLHARLNRPLRC